MPDEQNGISIIKLLSYILAAFLAGISSYHFLIGELGFEPDHSKKKRKTLELKIDSLKNEIKHLKQQKEGLEASLDDFSGNRSYDIEITASDPFIDNRSRLTFTHLGGVNGYSKPTIKILIRTTAGDEVWEGPWTIGGTKQINNLGVLKLESLSDPKAVLTITPFPSP